MEIWVDCRTGSPSNLEADFVLDCNEIYSDGTIQGKVFTIDSKQGQADAIAAVGSLSWIILEFDDWSMIPIENLIAAADSTPTRIAAIIRTAQEAQGAGFALEIGVDALVVPNDSAIYEAAQIIKSQRGELTSESAQESSQLGFSGLSEMIVTSIEQGGVGDRYCIDFTSLLEIGEGILVGSSSSSMALVHSETVASSYVPTRPFRVNAGAPHAYTLMADGKTKYLSELSAGDEVIITDSQGNRRTASIGRLKIEKRPMILFYFKNENNKESQLFLQQAETVRLVRPSGDLLAVTNLQAGDKIIGWSDQNTRHIGVAVSSEVVER